MKLFLPILFLLISLSGCCQTLIYPAAPNSSKPNTKQFAPAGFLCHVHPAAPFDPRTGGTLLSWYDATDLVNTTNSGGLVTTMKDKSGNGYDLSITSGGTKPTYHSSGGSNNLPYVSIVNGQELLPTTTMPLTGVTTTYYVMKNDGFTTSRFVLGLSNGNNTFLAQTTQPAGNTLTLNNGGQQIRNGNGYSTSWHCLNINWGGPNGCRMSMDNEPFIESNVTYNAGCAGTSSGNIVEFGPYYRNGSYSFEELLVYVGTPSYTNDSLIRDYLVRKYSTSKNKVYVFFGDSITYGAAASNTDSSAFAPLLCKDSSAQIVNAAYPGSAASAAGTGSVNAPGHNGTDIYFHPLQEKVDWSNTRVFFGFSTNDRNNSIASSTYRQKYIDSFELMINSYKAKGITAAHICVMTEPARQLGGFSALSAIDSSMYNVLHQIATETGVTWYDNITYESSTYSSSYLAGDGIHLTDAGMLAFKQGLEAILPP